MTQSAVARGSTDDDFQYFLENDFSQYEGEWIAIYDQQVIAHDEDERVVRKLARERADGEALISKIPDSNKILIM